VESLTLNPNWNPPTSIERSELLTRFRRDPKAADGEGFEAVTNDGNVLSADQIDWSARPFPYDLRQRPGAQNALGQIRFNLPNPYAIYLHDTPAKTLFERDKRALSHGCIRVRDPLRLAAALLNARDWDEAALQAEIDKGETTGMALSKAVPVYVLYLTMAVAPDGSATYFEDVYRRDAAIVKALDKAPPRTGS
jgi:murein L,D-transpeptidase YcbB/YkuD